MNYSQTQEHTHVSIMYAVPARNRRARAIRNYSVLSTERMAARVPHDLTSPELSSSLSHLRAPSLSRVILLALCPSLSDNYLQINSSFFFQLTDTIFFIFKKKIIKKFGVTLFWKGFSFNWIVELRVWVAINIHGGRDTCTFCLPSYLYSVRVKYIMMLIFRAR